MKRLLAFCMAVLLFRCLAVAQEGCDSVPGVGTRMHEEDPAEVLRGRAASGDTEAMNYLGYLLLTGGEGIERDEEAGLAWLMKAAYAGDVKAASNLGWLFLEGEVVSRDLEKGVGWLMKAAGAGLPVAQSLLGDLYRDGTGVASDTLAADSLYRAAFERGLADAGYKLYALNTEKYASMPAVSKVEAGLYFYLRGAPSEGVKLFYMAADEGSPEALALLGDAFTRAVGVPYDYELSKRYYVEAAVRGNPSAQFVVGELLEIFPDALKGNGEWDGLPADPAYWYEKAREGGVGDADTATKMLLRNPSPHGERQ